MTAHAMALHASTATTALPEQLQRFTVASMHAHPTGGFDPAAAERAMRARRSGSVLAVDMGGDKLAFGFYETADGAPAQTGEPQVLRSDGGAGYLDRLEALASDANMAATPVGISFAGPLRGSVVVAGPNVPILTAELGSGYGGDFANLFRDVSVANDAEAGLMAGAVAATRRFPRVRDVVYLVNGSGIGGAVLVDGTIWAAEPGHVEVDERLNPFGRREACGIFGAMYVCLENVAGGRAGIEETWELCTGTRLGGRGIAARLQDGDTLAGAIYEASAVATAHAILGQAGAFGVSLRSERTAVVCHGGVFRAPGYGDRVLDLLQAWEGAAVQMLQTDAFSANACLDGAAIAALARP